jgi:hypothetical protein
LQNAVPAEVAVVVPPALRAVHLEAVPEDPYTRSIDRTRSYLMTVATRAMELAAVEDDAADAMARLADQTFLVQDRDRLVVLAERSRAHAESQRRMARRLWDRIGVLSG